MVGAAAQEGQAKGDIHAVVESHVFDRDQPLVVILRDDDVKAALTRLHEHRVARPGARKGQSCLRRELRNNAQGVLD